MTGTAPKAPHAPRHEPFLRRLRRAGRDPAAFRVGRGWFLAGLVALAALALLPAVRPTLAGASERLATLLALVFLMAAVGLWLGMKGRAFAVAAVFVASLYLLTFWTRLAFPLEDFFVVAVLASFAVFALAGFNLVFVLEEVVFDAHRKMHLVHRAWGLLPTALCVALTVLLPAWRWLGGPSMTALWNAAWLCALLLLFWWTIVWAHRVQSDRVLPELHLVVASVLAATALADAVRLLNQWQSLPSLVPSLLAYGILLITWVYASYTTLQRTHFLLPGDNWRPWLAILLGASFAILAHSHALVEREGARAVADLVDLRFTWLIAGVWLGIAFSVGRGLTRALQFVRDSGALGARALRVAGRAQRVTGSLAATERLLEGTAYLVFESIDHVLPGTHEPPHRRPKEPVDEDAKR
jgi:hypothetical protein